MADGAPSSAESLGIAGTWRRLSPEQRVAGVGALLLAVSTLGPFSFVEVAELLVAFGVLLLLKKRAEGREFHLPFGDGAVIAAAGAWAAILIVIRLLDRPLGQNALALACAAILVGAGLRERQKRPMDDLPEARFARDRLAKRAAEPEDPATEALPSEEPVRNEKGREPR